MQIIIKAVIGCLVAALLVCLTSCRPIPTGGFSWTFVTYSPVIKSGDGSSFETAYLLKKGQARYLGQVEIETIRNRYWPPQRPSEDFYGKCLNSMVSTNAEVNGRAYEILTLTLPEGPKTVYFDVTDYRQKNN